MTQLRLVRPSTAAKAKAATSPRPYTTDYGTTQGHCATPHGAIRSAVNHLMACGQKHAVIERQDGPPIDVWYNGHWGVVVQVRKGGKHGS